MNAPLSSCRNREILSTRKQKRRNPEAGGIAVLPNEIIITIISRLTLKEAARTSFLSRRWRDLWKFTSGSLDFDGRDTRIMMAARPFVNWVDQVLKLHQGPSVDKLSIRFGVPMRPSSPNPIHSWIHFVIQKEVRVFELESMGRYFPELEKLLSITRAVKPQRSHFVLVSVRLVDVHVKDDVVEYLLSNCPRLEQLSIVRSKHTKKLKVVGPSLKSLVIGHCRNLKRLQISAVNLVSFKYSQSSLDFSTSITYKNVPLLSELSISGEHCRSFIELPRRYSKCARQLEKLELIVQNEAVDSWRPIYGPPSELPRLQNLKHLDLVLCAAAGESFIFFVLLTKACPLLSRIVVKFAYTGALSKQVTDFFSYGEIGGFLCSGSDFRHECLKVVKLIGFGAYTGDLGFALALIRIAHKSLQKLVIKPYGHYYQRITRVRERAKLLEAYLPPGAALVML